MLVHCQEAERRRSWMPSYLSVMEDADSEDANVRGGAFRGVRECWRMDRHVEMDRVEYSISQPWGMLMPRTLMFVIWDFMAFANAGAWLSVSRNGTG